MKSLSVCLIAWMLTMAVWAAEDPDKVYAEGVAQLQAAQADPKALVPAVKLLAKAYSLYEAAKAPEDKLQEVNSCLYWAKKKMTLADTESIKGEQTVVHRVDAAAKPVEMSDSAKWFKRADDFASKNATEQLIIAIRYFEVADRFKDSDEGRKAMDLSLKALQQVQIVKKDTKAPASVAGEKLKVTKIPKIDIDKLTAEIWAQAPGKEIKVSGSKFTDTKVELVVGEEYVVLPHPTDKWSWGKGNWTYKGDKTYKGRLQDEADVMALLFKVNQTGEWKALSNEPITGEGIIYFGPNDDQVNDNNGFVRIKIVRIK